MLRSTVRPRELVDSGLVGSISSEGAFQTSSSEFYPFTLLLVAQCAVFMAYGDMLRL